MGVPPWSKNGTFIKILVHKYPKTAYSLENSTFIQTMHRIEMEKISMKLFPNCSHKNHPVIIIDTSGIIRHMICSRPRAPLTQISGRKERGKMFLTHRAFELKVTTWHFYRYLSHFGPPKNRHSLDNTYFLFSWNPDQFHLRTYFLKQKENQETRMKQKQAFH